MPRPIWPNLFLKCSLKFKNGFYGEKNSNNCWEDPKNSPFLFKTALLGIKTDIKTDLHDRLHGNVTTD